MALKYRKRNIKCFSTKLGIKEKGRYRKVARGSSKDEGQSYMLFWHWSDWWVLPEMLGQEGSGVKYRTVP